MLEHLLALDFRLFLGLALAAFIALGSLAVYVTDRLERRS